MTSVSRAGVVAALILIAPISGCLETESDAVAPAGSAGPAAGGPSPGLAPPDEVEEVASAPTFVVTDFGYDGEIGSQGCAWLAIAGECFGGAGTRTFEEVPFRGRGEAIEGTLTWDAETPASGNLAIYLLTSADGGSSWNHTRDHPFAEGPSPISFAWDIRPWADAKVAFHVSGFTWVSAGVVGAGASAPQPFRVEGQVRSLVPETP